MAYAILTQSTKRQSKPGPNGLDCADSTLNWIAVCKRLRCRRTYKGATMSEQSTELARPAADIMQFGGGAGRLATSFDLQAESGRRKMLACLQDCDARLTDEVNVQLDITDYLVHDVEINNKDTGEVIAATRMVLTDDKGCTHECVSLTLLRSMQRLAYVFGPPPWSPPRKLTVKSKRKGERNIYWLDCE